MKEGRAVKQFNVYLPVGMIRAVKYHAVDTEQSLSAVVEAALSDYLSRTERGRRERKHGH